MTDIDVERANQIAAKVVTDTLKQFEYGLLLDEQFVSELYGKLVVAHAMGWDIGSMSEEAAKAGDRLLDIVEKTSTETEQE